MYKGFRSDCLSHDRRIDIDRDEPQYVAIIIYVTIVRQTINETLNPSYISYSKLITPSPTSSIYEVT